MNINDSPSCPLLDDLETINNAQAFPSSVVDEETRSLLHNNDGPPTPTGDPCASPLYNMFDSPKEQRQQPIIDIDPFLLDKQQEHIEGLAGIDNYTGNVCFYISVIQALCHNPNFKTLMLLINEANGDSKSPMFVKQMASACYLLEHSKKTVSIRRVVDYGPEIFRKPVSQQDASQCLIMVMDQIERQLSEMKQKFYLEMLKESFELRQSVKVECLSCQKTISKRDELKFVHSVHFQQDLDRNSVEEVAYNCQDCQSGTALLYNNVSNSPNTLIVYMKRYKFDGTSTKKATGPSHMPLKFEQYELEGFICHIGSYQNSGHYVYYWNDGKEWYVFDDSRVRQLSSASIPEFWLEFHDNQTPLIALYNKKN